MANITKEKIASFPKIELHLHLEGAIRKKTLRALAQKQQLSNQYIDILLQEETTQYEGLGQFISTMRCVGDICLKTASDYEQIAYELFEDLARQNVVYAEVSYDPIRGKRLGIPIHDIITSVYQAKLKAERKWPIHIGLIMGLGREHGQEIVSEFVQIAISSKELGIIGLDLHGNEASYSPKDFAKAFAKAKESGLGLRAHAGEELGPQSIWDTIHSLKVSRIGHGIHAIEDESLINYLVQHAITLDICPSSNYMLGLVPSFSAHPIRALFNRGIHITVSTDDPLYFRTTLNDEYHILQEHLGFTQEELKALNLYAVEASFLPNQMKTQLTSIIENGYR